MKRIVFKARLGGGPVQEVGGYEFLPDEWEEELRLSGFPEERAWLLNTGVDWAHEAALDKLRYWAEVEEA